MRKKTTRKKTIPKKTRGKKTTSKKTNRTGVSTAPKKKVIVKRRIVKQKNEETILSKIKDVFDDTAAKIKTLLPGESEATPREPDQRNRPGPGQDPESRN